MFRSWMSRYRIPLSFLIGVGILLLAKPSSRSIIGGFPFVVLGEALRIWSSGHIKKNQELATDGPYAYTRNPLYLGSFLIGFGFSVMVNRPLLLLLFLSAFFMVYRAVIVEEEAALTRLFGEVYLSYARMVPRFFPRLPDLPDRQAGGQARWPGGSKIGGFDWRLVIKHREYYAWFGAVLGLGWLLWKV